MMGTLYSEIVELEQGSEHESSFTKPSKKFYVEDDINRLFESIRVSTRASGLPQVLRDNLRKKSMKRPIRVGPYQPSGMGISEPVSLKQALRGLSISQASEMAALKRLSKPIAFSQAPEARPVKTLEPIGPVDKESMGRRTLGQARNLKLKLYSLSTRARKKLETVPGPLNESMKQETHRKPELHSFSSFGPNLIKNQETDDLGIKDSNLCKPESVKQETGRKPEFQSPSSIGPDSIKNQETSDDLSIKDSSRSKPELITEVKRRRNINKPNKKSRSREKGEFSQSSKSSSLGECSSSTSFSCESNLSGYRSFRPHMSKDSRWEAIKQHRSLNLRNFKLIKKIGGGDIGTIYLAELIGSNYLFALKILDIELLGVRKKGNRAQTEREILQLLDHPFLPTLFSQFTTDKYSCLVMEYCPGGDLHVLRQKQPEKCFSEKAARFYVAEILLALEYLHMLGIVYRDLKPENILVREDGHIMLTDFDLSLRCNPNPTLLKPPLPIDQPKPTEPGCIDPFCQVSCFTPRLQPNTPVNLGSNPKPTLVVEPICPQSNSFVGTQEYLAPEIVKGEGHGSPVDWWTFGVLLYELLYGRTPFKGTGDDETLANVVARGLRFPESPVVSSRARDLVRGLLRKRPEDRLGAVEGAAEIRRHPFFEGLNWALIRCAVPPEIPKVCDYKSVVLKNSEFDMF